MKTFNILKVCGPAAALLLTACNGWLSEPTPGVTKLEDFFTQGETCVQTVNGCYAPLAWEFNSSYFSEWFIGDIASDDALKGGQNKADGADAYDIDNFKTNANNTILLDYYRAKFMGISRCNLAIREVAKFKPDTTLTVEERDRLVGEAYFLRGFYYFQLVRVFGGVPLTLEVLDSAEKWTGPRATSDEVYSAILSDLANAEKLLWEKDEYEDEDLGRATRGAALAMLCKVNLYVKNYEAAYEWGRKFYEEDSRAAVTRSLPTMLRTLPLPARMAAKACLKSSICRIRPATMAKASALRAARSARFLHVRVLTRWAQTRAGAGIIPLRISMMNSKPAIPALLSPSVCLLKPNRAAKRSTISVRRIIT